MEEILEILIIANGPYVWIINVFAFSIEEDIFNDVLFSVLFQFSHINLISGAAFFNSAYKSPKVTLKLCLYIRR